MALLQIFADRIAEALPLPARGSLSIGRTHDNDIAIDDASLSRRHATLHLGAQPAIEDLGSKNGTTVRSVRADEGTAQVVETRVPARARHALAPGDVIQLGSVVLSLHADAALPPGALLRSALSTLSGARAALPPGMVLVDREMHAVVDLATRVAVGDIPVLLLGETGVGKDVLADVIHRASRRAGGPLLRLNCAAVAGELIESELFGHERGAFTGAHEAKPGLLETANGGTVFLDEVGEMPAGTQAKLLRVIEAGEVLRVGGLKPRRIDVRYVAATNRDPEADIARGQFRRDLYYRLAGVTLVIPPLRERPDEIAALAERFAAAAADKLGRRVPRLSPEALAVLARHRWPGNVRELRNVIERAVLLGGDAVRAEHLRLEVAPRMVAGAGGDLADELAAVEKARILAALDECDGNQSEVARRLGMPRRTLVKRLREYGISRPRPSRDPG